MHASSMEHEGSQQRERRVQRSTDDRASSYTRTAMALATSVAPHDDELGTVSRGPFLTSAGASLAEVGGTAQVGVARLIASKRTCTG
jgi:hypothetical protein